MIASDSCTPIPRCINKQQIFSGVMTYPLYDFSMMMPPYHPYPTAEGAELYAFPSYWPTPPFLAPTAVCAQQPSCFSPTSVAVALPALPSPLSPRAFALSHTPHTEIALPSPITLAPALPLIHQQGYPPGPPPGPVVLPQPSMPQPLTQTQPPDEQFLWNVFQRVNRDKSGYISASELQSALSNGTWKPFNPETVRMMIDMFGKEKRSSVNLIEFGSLWSYVSEWLTCFQSFDTDYSGNIDREELKDALHAFGYRMTEKFYGFLVYKFDREGKGAVNFDDFIQCCVVLQALTTSFRGQDEDQDGWVRMTYEHFLLTVFKLRL